MMSGRTVHIPSSFNYIGAFLTFRCPFRCSYCINRHDGHAPSHRETDGHSWIDFFERLDSELPVTLQGGEPGMHADFISIVEKVSRCRHVDILTNLCFNLNRFVDMVNPAQLNRDAPYAPIRVSYHPEQFSLMMILDRVTFLINAGFRVGLYGVMHPHNVTAMEHARMICADMGVDFRTKPFLGWHDGKLMGEFAYPDACTGKSTSACECSASELLIAPDGGIYPCHHHLYHGVNSSGSIHDSAINLDDKFHACHYYGQCNPCDVKVKNNRFQQFGHVSMRIRLPADALHRKAS